jgi:hypothetical protein
MLGDTPAICRKCYIHPAVLDGYVDSSLLSSGGPTRSWRIPVLGSRPSCNGIPEPATATKQRISAA